MSAQAIPPAVCSDRRQQLTEQIRTHALAAHAELLDPVRVKNAIACGKALSEVRELLVHGEWTAWVEQQCGLNRMTANRYMRDLVVSAWPQVTRSIGFEQYGGTSSSTGYRR